MAFRYQLRAASGDDLGEAEYGYQPQPDDVIHVAGSRMRVCAIVPAERIGEFIDRPIFGMLEIEPA